MDDPRAELLHQELTRRRAELATAFDAVPPERRGSVPRSGGWSVAMVVEHLVQTERSITALLAKLVRDVPRRTEDAFSRDGFLRHIDMPGFLDRTRKIKGSQPSGAVRAEEAWAALRRTRQELLGVLRQSAGLRLEDRSFDHPAGAALDGYQWAAFLALHEARHAAQIREIHASLRSGDPAAG